MNGGEREESRRYLRRKDARIDGDRESRRRRTGECHVDCAMSHSTSLSPKETRELSALLYDRPEAAARLAISLRTLDEQVALGNIQVVRIGRSVRFRPSALEFFIEANETRLTAKRRAAIRGKKKQFRG